MIPQDIYQKEPRLASLRSQTQNASWDQLIPMAWAEYFHGRPHRARENFARARRLAPKEKQEYAALNAFLVEDLIRGRNNSDQKLQEFWQRSQNSSDPSCGQLAMAYFLDSLNRQGCSLATLGEQIQSLLQLAQKTRSWLAPSLGLRVARNQFEQGHLNECLTWCKNFLKQSTLPAEQRGLFEVLSQVSESLLYDTPLPERSGEELTFLGRLEATILRCHGHLKLGQRKAAQERLSKASRLAHRHRISDALHEVAVLRCRLALAERKPQCALKILGTLSKEGVSPYLRLRTEVLKAKALFQCGHLRQARRILAANQQAREQRGEAFSVQEAALLSLQFQMVSRPQPHDLSQSEQWQKASRWQDVGNRLRMLAELLSLPHKLRTRYTLRRSLASLCRAKNRRALVFLSLYKATLDRVRCRRESAAERLNPIDYTPLCDTEEHTLSRWHHCLKNPKSKDLSPQELSFVENFLATREEKKWILSNESQSFPVDSSGLQRALLDVPQKDLSLNALSRIVTVRGTELDFRRRERALKLLACLMKNPQGLSIAALTKAVWNRERLPYETDQLLHTGTYRLRRQLGHLDWIEVRQDENEENFYLLKPGLSWVLIEKIE